MEGSVDESVQTQALIDAAFAIEEVLETVLGGLPIGEIFANRRVAKAWRKAGFRALRSKRYAYNIHHDPNDPVKEDMETFENMFSVECYIPISSSLLVIDDSVVVLSKEYSKFVVVLWAYDVPAGFQFQWGEIGEFPRLESIRVFTEEGPGIYYPKTDPFANFLSKTARNSKYLKKFDASISIESGMDEGDLPLELTDLTVDMDPDHTLPEASCLLTPYLPNLKVLTVHINEEVIDEQFAPGADLQNVQRVKKILEKFSPQLEKFMLLVDRKHLLPFLRMPRMEKLRQLDCEVPILSADESKTLPQVLPELKSLRIHGESQLVFGTIATFGENCGLEELVLSFRKVERGENLEAFPPVIRMFRALKSLDVVCFHEGHLHIPSVWFEALQALPSLKKLRFKGDIEVDPALIEAWTSSGRQIKMEP